jgi:hypothetical protein
MTQSRKSQPSKPRATNAPKTETPEDPAPPPREPPRAEEPEEETSEAKPESLGERLAQRREEFEKGRADEEADGEKVEEVDSPSAASRAETVVLHVDPGELALAIVSGEADLSNSQLEVLQLRQHVAQSPVDAHAPVWVPREPNGP